MDGKVVAIIGKKHLSVADSIMSLTRGAKILVAC